MPYYAAFININVNGKKGFLNGIGKTKSKAFWSAIYNIDNNGVGETTKKDVIIAPCNKELYNYIKALNEFPSSDNVSLEFDKKTNSPKALYSPDSITVGELKDLLKDLDDDEPVNISILKNEKIEQLKICKIRSFRGLGTGLNIYTV